MAQLTVGLAPNRTSYYDKITNTYITLQNPVQQISFDEMDVEGTVKRLEKIVHALFASVPALVLYEGTVPAESVDAWKAKYMKPFNTDMSKLVRNLHGEIVAPAVKANRAFDRPEQVNDAPVEVIAVNLGDAELVSEKELQEASAKSSTLVDEKEESPEEAKTGSRKKTGQKADK